MPGGIAITVTVLVAVFFLFKFLRCYHEHCLFSRVPVTVRFTPAWEKEVNFNVVCMVKRKQIPLTLNVKAEGYTMNCLVTCEDPSGDKQEFSTSSRNFINFGRVWRISIYTITQIHKVITTMVIWPLDDHAYCARSAFTHLLGLW